MKSESEADAVAARYARRSDAGDRYSLLRPDVWQTVQERQRAMLALFSQLGWIDLSQRHLTEVGCGSGSNLLELLRLGFDPAKLIGVELLAERCAKAREVLPAALTLHQADATTLNLPDGHADTVFVSTVFSSLLDNAFQQRLADTMWRWVRPGGGVLWYDFTVDNPRNPDVRGMPVRRVRELFPQASVVAQRVTLAPPIARRVTRVHPSLYTAFNLVPALRTHVLAWIAKP